MTYLNLNRQLEYFKETILKASGDIWHYRRPAGQGFPFGIWQEYSESDSEHASNRKKAQPVLIYLDWYTQREFDPIIDRIQNVLNEAPGIAFELSDVQYEEDTNVIHYSWNVEVEHGEAGKRWL